MAGTPPPTQRAVVTLPVSVLERVPELRDQRPVFFDFGIRLVWGEGGAHAANADPGKPHQQPVVVVITEDALIVAAFPGNERGTREAPVVLPHPAIAGISREGPIVIVRNSADGELHLRLPKSDTFAVHLINRQDRSLNRALRVATQGSRDPPTTASTRTAPPSPNVPPAVPPATHRAETLSPATLIDVSLQAESAQRKAEATLADRNVGEAALGVVRFGASSSRTTRPPVELDEGSDASSVETLMVEEEEEEGEGVEDGAEGNALASALPQVSIDPQSLQRRLHYMFLKYDPSRLPFVDRIVAQHRGRERELLHSLEQQYGPEPKRELWDARDRQSYLRDVTAQLRAQLRRAEDERLLLRYQPTQRTLAAERVEALRRHFLSRMLASEEEPVEAAADQHGTIEGQQGTAAAESGAMRMGGRTPKPQPIAVAAPPSQARGFFEAIELRPLGSAAATATTNQPHYFVAPTALFDRLAYESVAVVGAQDQPVVEIRVSRRRPTPPSGGTEAGANDDGHRLTLNRNYVACVAGDYLGPGFVLSVEQNGRWFFVPSEQLLGG